MDVYRIGNEPKVRLAEFVDYDNRLAISILLIDLIIYAGSVIAAVVIDSIMLKILFSSIAGFMIAQLFVIGHDAAHKAYASGALLNQVIARIVFFPTLHNYNLWLFAHNRLHHAFPNMKNYNSWSPMSQEEYQKLPRWRQLLEQIYRSPLGFGPYYIVERWLKDKFIPRKHIPRQFHKKGWQDFAFLMLYSTVFLASLSLLALYAQQSVALAILFGAVVPFIIWNYAMGLTVYQQHTHPTVKWYSTLADWKGEIGSQSEVSIHIKYPAWYNFITHNCYYHPVHHVNPKIPIYRLKKAQEFYARQRPELSVIIPFTFAGFMETIKSCKLYDYDKQQWLDFKGRPTSPALKKESIKRQEVAV